MRNRSEILLDIINLTGNLNDLQTELSQYPWDIEVPIVTLNKSHLINVIEKCMNGDFNFEQTENWANAIESREDVEFENEQIEETIFELANPELYGKLTRKRLKELVSYL